MSVSSNPLSHYQSVVTAMLSAADRHGKVGAVVLAA